MDLRNYLWALRRSWWIVVVFIVVGAAAGVGLVAAQTPVYSSSVTFFVSTPSVGGSTPLQSAQFGQQRVASYGALLKSEELADQISTVAGINMSPTQIQSAISSSVNTDTVLINATVQATSRSRSLDIATAIADKFGPMVDKLENPSTSSIKRVTLNVVSGPKLNSGEVSPKKTLDIGLGVILGLAVGLLVALIREQARLGRRPAVSEPEPASASASDS